LKTKGVHITDKGVAVKTSRRFDREDYVDATQRCAVSRSLFAVCALANAAIDRGIVKAVGASSFGKRSDSDVHLSPAPALASTPSSSSVTSTSSGGEKKKRGLFKRSAKDS
jgi:hypothetical protein